MLTPVEVEQMYPIDRVEVFQNGLVIHRKARVNYPRKFSPRKGIYEMSKKSKLRLTHIVTNSPLKFKSMMTLTWGDFMPPVNGKELKRQMNIFLNRLRKHYKNIEYLWFLEFTTKGRPHFHVLLTSSPSTTDNFWLGKTWSEITTKDAWLRLSQGKVKDYKIEKDLPVTLVLDEWEKSRKVHSHKKAWQDFYKPDGAFRYCLKYATKSEQKLVPVEFADVGRFWGTSKNVAPKPIAETLLGETMSRDGLNKVLEDTRIAQLPLIPKYIFQKDALEYFSQRGLKLTEIFSDNPSVFIDKMEGEMIPLKTVDKGQHNRVGAATRYETDAQERKSESGSKQVQLNLP